MVILFHTVFFQLFEDRRAEDDGRDKQEDIVYERRPEDPVGKRVAVQSDQILEEITQLAEVFKVEDTETDGIDEDGVSAHDGIRDLTQSLLCDGLLDRDKDAKI